MGFECEELPDGFFENECNKEIVSCLMQTQMQLFKAPAYIVRREQLDKGNFFHEYIEEGRQYIPVTLSISRLRDDGTKDDKDQQQITESIEAYYMGEIKLLRSDMILYRGAYYDTRDLFTQEWNTEGDWIYQKFQMVFVQNANDAPELEDMAPE